MIRAEHAPKNSINRNFVKLHKSNCFWWSFMACRNMPIEKISLWLTIRTIIKKFITCDLWNYPSFIESFLLTVINYSLYFLYCILHKDRQIIVYYNDLMWLEIRDSSYHRQLFYACQYFLCATFNAYGFDRLL